MSRLILAALAVFLAVPAASEVTIRFDLDESSGLRALYEPSTEGVETGVEAELARQLGPYFPHWVLVAGDDQCNYRLQFRLDSERPRVMSLHAELWSSTTLIDGWDTVWLQPGDAPAGGYPTFSAAPRVFADVIVSALVRANRERMFEQLKRIPIVTTGVWKRPLGAEEPRIVLPLKFQPEGRLNHSTFRVYCDWNDPARGEARVTGISFGAKDKYPARPPYDAIVLRPLHVIDRGVRRSISTVPLNQLHEPKLVYLESETAIAEPEGGNQ